MEEVVAKAKIKKVGYIYGCVIDQDCEVSMAGYWPSSSL